MQKIKKIFSYFIYLVLFVSMIFIMLKRIFVSCDIDEIHSLVESWRLVKGDAWFRDDWNIYMMSSLLESILLRIKILISGDLTYAIIYIRVISTMIQIGISCLCYYVMRNYVKLDKQKSVLISLLIILYTFKKNLAPDYANLQIWIPFIIFLIMICYCNKARDIYFAFVGLLLSLLILAYPTYVILVPVYLIGLCNLKQKKRGYFIFFSTCGGCFLVFLFYLLRNMTYKEVVENIRCTMQISSHTSKLLDKYSGYGSQIIAELMIIIAISIISILLVKLFNQKKGMLFVYVVLLDIAYEIVECVRSNSDWHLRYVFLITIFGTYLLRNARKEYIWFGYLPGICTYISTIIGTDIPKFTNSYKAFFLSAFVVLSLYLKEENGEVTEKEIRYNRKQVLAVGVVLFYLIFQNVFFIRVSSRVENVFGFKGTRVETGILKGIYVNGYEVNHQKKVESMINSNLKENGELLYLGMNVGVYCSENGKYDIASPSLVWSDYGNPTVFEEYYVKHPDKNPDLIVYEKEYPVIESRKIPVFVAGEIVEKIRENYRCIYTDEDVEIYQKNN